MLLASETTTRRTGLQATVPLYLTNVTVDEHGFIVEFDIAFVRPEYDSDVIRRAITEAINLDEPEQARVYDEDDRYLAGHPGTPPGPPLRRRIRWALRRAALRIRGRRCGR